MRSPKLLPTTFLALLFVGACATTQEATPPETASAPAAAEQEEPAPAPHGGFRLVQLIPNGRTPGPGLVTGGQPTPEALEVAKAEGIRTVVNLRPDSEMTIDEAALVEQLGMSYASIPVAGPAGLTDEAVDIFDFVMKQEGPKLIHCGSGNRVGAMFALRAYRKQGVAPDVALQIGLDHGLTSLRPVVEAKLAEPAPAAEPAPQPEAAQ